MLSVQSTSSELGVAKLLMPFSVCVKREMRSVSTLSDALGPALPLRVYTP
jgi:hypothetical protein